ncbi:hypothetical protein [Amnibacterium kyonggiense]
MDGDELRLLHVGADPGQEQGVVGGVGEGFGPGPVIAQTVTSAARAASAARTRFVLVPLVESRTRTSPGRPCAVTWRANASS